MSKKVSIETFIENRWAEAKTELERIAPKFVPSLQAHDTLMKHGFLLPEGLPAPGQRLPVTWHELLEATWDVTQAVQRLEITLEFLEGNAERKLARYFFEVWVQSAYSLCEKVESLAAHTCKIHSINQKIKKGYYGLLKPLQEEIEKSRTAIVHGVNRPKGGGTPITATAITQDGLWEVGVFLGPGIIKEMIEQSYQSGYLSPKDYYNRLRETTEVVLNRLSGVLESLDQEAYSKKKWLLYFRDAQLSNKQRDSPEMQPRRVSTL